MQTEPEGAIGAEVTRLVTALSPDPPADIRPDMLLSDLGMDSLACADLAVSLEERFGVRLAEADVDSLRSVQDVTTALERSPGLRPRIPAGIGRFQQPGEAIAGWAFAWYARLHVEGLDNFPATGPVIVAANHRSFLDVPLMVIASPRPIVFMAKRELFKNRPVAWFLHVTGGFPVRREIADLGAIDIALAVLERGWVLGLYPEGTRNYGDGMLPFLRGAAWLGMHTGAPIVPCGILGTEKRPLRAALRRRVRVEFGPPIAVEREPDPVARRHRSGEITERLRTDIERLLVPGVR